MATTPKRNKSKDNPYTLEFDEVNNLYFVIFNDNKNQINKVQVSKEVYLAFDNFELEDISQIHKYRSHIEHSELFEETIYNRSFNKPQTVEEKVETNILYQKLKSTINILPEIQKRRLIKYFVYEKTYEQVAIEEKCTKRAVKFSIDIALEKI